MHLNFEKLNHGWLRSKSSAVWRKSECDLGCAGLGWAPSGGTGGVEPPERRRPGPWPPAASPHLPRPLAAFGLPPPTPGTEVARLRVAARAPDPETGPIKRRASRGRRAGREEDWGPAGLVGVRGWRRRRCDAAARLLPDQRTLCPRLQKDPWRCSFGRRPSRERRLRRHPALTPSSRAARLPAL